MAVRLAVVKRTFQRHQTAVVIAFEMHFIRRSEFALSVLLAVAVVTSVVVAVVGKNVAIGLPLWLFPRQRI